MLNLLLKILNERIVSEVGAPPFRIPLLSVFAASNEGAPRGLEAFNDRFVLRQMVQDIKDDDNFLAMLEAEDQDPETFLSLDSIAAAQAERQAIAVPRAVKERVIELRHALETERIFPSPRRYKKAMKVLQARAWMDGLPEVDMDCCTVLRHVLWTDAKEEGIVRKLVHEAFSPLSVAAGAMADMALSLLVGGIPDKSDSDFMVRCEDATRQLVNMQERHVLEMTRSGARDMRASLDALQEVERIKKAVARLTIGQARDEVLKAAQSGA